jgi:hypothetical protein
MKVKSHKGPGKVKARAIHDGSKTSFSHAGAFISNIMEQHNTTWHGQLLRDSSELLWFLERSKIPGGSIIAVFDIKDYYPTPAHETLSARAGEAYLKAASNNQVKAAAFA